MLAHRRLPLVFAATLACAPFPTAGEVLYNGITLPDVWPPARSAEDVKSREPQPVPYLETPPAVIPIDLGRQLFVDDFLVESTTLRREFHHAQFHPGNPLLKPEGISETEGKLPMSMPFSDGVWFDPKDQLFKMWYMAGWCKQTAFATSRDGLRWERPALDVKPGTNVVQADGRDSSTVWLDLEERDPERRYKMWRAHSEEKRFGLSLHFSANGVHWGPRVLRTGSIGDRSTVFWNPFRKVWVYSLRHGFPAFPTGLSPPSPPCASARRPDRGGSAGDAAALGWPIASLSAVQATSVTVRLRIRRPMARLRQSRFSLCDKHAREDFEAGALHQPPSNSAHFSRSQSSFTIASRRSPRAMQLVTPQPPVGGRRMTDRPRQIRCALAGPGQTLREGVRDTHRSRRALCCWRELPPRAAPHDRDLAVGQCGDPIYSREGVRRHASRERRPPR